MRTPSVTPLGALARGVLAGAAGTLAMDLLWYRRYRSGGGADGFKDWELSSGLDSWEDAGPPAQVGRRLVEGLTQRDLPGERAALVNDVTHWAYGTVWGAQYGLVAGSVPRSRLPWSGPLFGALVWGSDYVVLPALGLYKPIWEYDKATLWQDLSAHLVYGTVTDLAFRALARAR